jgi:hypothetical protein
VAGEHDRGQQAEPAARAGHEAAEQESDEYQVGGGDEHEGEFGEPEDVDVRE